MGFAKFKEDEYQELGMDALDDKLEFTDFDLLSSSLDRICKGTVEKEMVEIVLSKNCD